MYWLRHITLSLSCLQGFYASVHHAFPAYFNALHILYRDYSLKPLRTYPPASAADLAAAEAALGFALAPALNATWQSTNGSDEMANSFFPSRLYHRLCLFIPMKLLCASTRKSHTLRRNTMATLKENIATHALAAADIKRDGCPLSPPICCRLLTTVPPPADNTGKSLLSATPRTPSATSAPISQRCSNNP